MNDNLGRVPGPPCYQFQEETTRTLKLEKPKFESHLSPVLARQTQPNSKCICLLSNFYHGNSINSPESCFLNEKRSHIKFLTPQTF